ncbi:UDP-N-acetylmuramoylalanyl-D-glutamyl-2, 6-diaminopimelate--D-alanyl-D-alanyl ligase [Prochlorococcus marinus str. MIT 9515]|uniref:UDP-N-acetylmuramoyl-tripeptide--D-alanyl-D-alanine ligase n=1 Tax=Prochlorococcus marinus (strain MIT 9515) TaxID=167542 RepID=A2BVS3_PROM5|nr:UDP-N-acetylmuramoyl-tripeptide--D-alanyl-D-alanine ligase [Prochlorococcus marinus]ABM71884.1 UDP-N-acetylmuramoylalanyl-D-glutamyl-2, 6-diaminopimelate--D-alanyl-D-alanyl ligase [Prochlorococcus marinus str. MIT 9515]
MDFSVCNINTILGNLKNSENLKNQSQTFKNISLDSRNILNNDLFIAIKGKNFDGHDFLKEVLKKGVKAVVIRDGMQHLLPEKFPYWLVPNTLESFQKLALHKRRTLNIPVVGITGSVGKTTTKEMMGEVLKQLGKIKLTQLNYNNEIGVGRTILDSDFKDKILIIEMGMRGLGQIENLSKFSEPDIAVITNIGSSHIGILGSKENITYAKCEITKYLKPSGVVIIPANDLFLEETLKKNWSGRIIKVDLLDINQKVDSINKKNLIGFFNRSNNSIIIEDKLFEISLKGFHNAFNFLFVYAVAKEFGIEFKDTNKFNFLTLDGRNKIIKSKKTVIYDETYNASPESLKACIINLLNNPNNHFLIFGSIQELGSKSKKYHKELFDFIVKSDIKKCIFICDRNDEIYYADYLKKSTKFIFFNDVNKVGITINKYTKKGDFILVKGSRNWQLESILKSID